MAASRSIKVLLVVVGAIPQMPYTGAGILEAYNAGLISKGEAQKLQSHGRLSPKAQKRELSRAKPVADVDLARLRTGLDEKMAQLKQLDPQRVWGSQ